MKVLNVYKWATVGGVERVILNRAIAFKKHGINVKQDVFFFHDSGGLSNFRKFIEKCDLGDYIGIVTKINEKNYDLIITFDTPEIFDMIKNSSKLIVECHSPYKESRAYLKTMPKDIACLSSPGETFLQTVVYKEIPEEFKEKTYVLPNFHIMDKQAVKENGASEQKIWSKKPLCYIGRMDAMKNTKELLDIFSTIRKELGDEYFLMLVGDVRPHYMDLKETLRKTNLEDRVAYFRPIPYEKVDVLFRNIKTHNGIFVSPSQGESFGLSALEAMTNKVPVLLSDIDCHKPLVASENDYLYELGNINMAVEKIDKISKNYNELSNRAGELGSRHNSEAFIDAWKGLAKKINER